MSGTTDPTGNPFPKDPPKRCLPLSPTGRRYGRYHENPNHPARVLLRAAPPTGVILPPSMDLSPWMGPIRDQGEEGSCTGQMGAAMRDLLYRKQYAYEKQRTILSSEYKASAAFVYKCNLIADGLLGTDAGSTVHQTAVTLNQKGAALESEEPYVDGDYSTPPTSLQYNWGSMFCIGAYHYLPNLLDMKACLASGYSFGFGIDVYESFEGDWKKPGFMPMPNLNREQMLGGHAQHVIGYDDAIEFPDGCKGGLYVQNSWGSGWGINAPGRTDGGTYWIPYKFVMEGMASDAWVVHLGKPW